MDDIDFIDKQENKSEPEFIKSDLSPTNSILLKDLQNMKREDHEHSDSDISKHSKRSTRSRKSNSPSIKSYPKRKPSYSSSSSSYSLRSRKDKSSQNEIMHRKQELLFELDRLERRGKTYFKKLTLSSPLEDIQSAFERLQLDDELEDNVDNMREWLITIISIFEKVVMSDTFRKYSPIKLNLRGWSQAVNANIKRFDKAFKDLYIKYRSSAQVPPEIRIIGLVFGSAVMYHLANSTLTQIPGLDQMMKNNPEIISSFMSFMQNNGQSAFAQSKPDYEMNSNKTNNNENQQEGGGGGGGGFMNNVFSNMKHVFGFDTSVKNNENNNEIKKSENEDTEKTKMKGPTSVDEILNEINQSNTPKKELSDDLSEAGDNISLDSHQSNTTNTKKPKRITRKKI